MKKVQILGTGCPKCKQLTQNAEQAAQELGIEKGKTPLTPEVIAKAATAGAAKLVC